MALHKPDRPLAIVDCNFIQGCRGEEDDVPQHWDCLVVTPVFAEFANKREHERVFLGARFARWLRRNAHRLWMGREWLELYEMQSDINHVRHIHSRDLVDFQRTRLLRRGAANCADDWLAAPLQPTVQQWLDNGDVNRNRFMNLTNEARDYVKALEGSLANNLPQTPDAIRAYVQGENMADYVISKSGNGPIRDWRWRRYLEGFPDRLIVAKFARLQLYYSIRRTLGDARKFENNYEDMHYAIAASYTGHIATSDTRLIRACELLAPGVRVFRLHHDSHEQ
jgi:hypothetical protein